MSEAKRREFIGSSLAALGAAAMAAAPRAMAKEQRPNVLWIIAEDFSPELACYGTPLVKTPNIDKLANEGRRYTQAFTPAPVCSASRSAFMTSMYQTSIGAHNHRSHRRDGYALPKPVRLITHYFREGGYFTANVRRFPSGLRGTGKTDWNFKPQGKPCDGSDWAQHKASQPCFAQVNVSQTHRGGGWRGAHEFSLKNGCAIDPAKVKLPPYYADHPVIRKDWATYLESAQLLDHNVGRLLRQLEADGLAENTVVFFFGDHGRCMFRGKQFLYDGGIRVPFIIRWPGKIQAGPVCDDLVNAIDFGPTCMTIAGIEPPKHLEGRDFLGPDATKRDYIFAARDRCDETVDRIRCVRTKRWKYLRNFMPGRPYPQKNAYKERAYPPLAVMKKLFAEGKLTPEQAHFMKPTRPAEELYDLAADPHEVHNLAARPEHQATLKRLRGVLEQWIKDTHDQGAIPEKEIWLPKRRKKKKK